MTTQSNIEKIKQVLKEINDARERATQGEWPENKSEFLNSDDMFFAQGPSATDVVADFDQKFIALAANKITSLTKALEVAVEALENVIDERGYRFSYIHMTDEEIARKAINQVASILEGSEGK